MPALTPRPDGVQFCSSLMLANMSQTSSFPRARAQTPALTPFPDLTAPEVAYPLFAQQDIDPRMVTRISGVYLKNLDMPELVEKVRF